MAFLGKDVERGAQEAAGEVTRASGAKWVVLSRPEDGSVSVQRLA